jgi:predicted O-methyltransferase YrrM
MAWPHHSALQDAATLAVKALNENLHRDARIDQSLVTIGDGRTLIRKRPA